MPGPHQQPQYITRALDQEVILLVASPSSQAAVTRQVSVGGGDPPRRGGGPGPGHRPVSTLTHCDTPHSVLELDTKVDVKLIDSLVMKDSES